MWTVQNKGLKRMANFNKMLNIFLLTFNFESIFFHFLIFELIFLPFVWSKISSVRIFE